MKKQMYLLGIVLGLIMPVVGVFFGLQVSVMLGNIFAFPIVVIAALTDKPFGMWNAGLWVVAMLFSVLAWTFIVAIVDRILRRIL